MNRILIIQTAFLGDVILSTTLVENIIAQYPEAKISMLVRKGNESLLNYTIVRYYMLKVPLISGILTLRHI